jgi:CO/xanthine dehydrogenase Mo-binding subunit
MARAHTTVAGTWSTGRVIHAQLETRGAIGRLDDDGRLVIRTSTQVPFLVRDELAYILGLDRDRIRVHAARVGGGFGGKQELFCEDLVALGVLRTGRPVAYELSRREEFERTAVRHPMRVSVTLGADEHGILTAMDVDVLSDTGAYGNHSRGVLFHSVAESLSLYRCPAKRLDAEVVYTNTVPSGAFRGYGLGQVIFAIESAMDELAIELGIDPFELRRRNAVKDGDDLLHHSSEPDADLVWGSYGLDQCLDLAHDALARGNGVTAPAGWLVGEGMAAAMIATMAPFGHISHVTLDLTPDGRYRVGIGTAEFGNGTTTVHAQIVATDLGTTPTGCSCTMPTRMRRGTTRAPSPRRASRWRAKRCTPRPWRSPACCGRRHPLSRVLRSRNARSLRMESRPDASSASPRSSPRRPRSVVTAMGCAPTEASSASSVRSRSTCTRFASRCAPRQERCAFCSRCRRRMPEP